MSQYLSANVVQKLIRVFKCETGFASYCKYQNLHWHLIAIYVYSMTYEITELSQVFLDYEVRRILTIK